ncbi:uracil-DNA glycosylase [Opitutus terrae]|uniref:Type-4 uracil-DNA glycosylase n=1 Tax=Opitutus terrae (strain DSM 11246 / JCM 15787 / PB90-1) TaxID=452637 RepID=B1ZZ66_OPITP|nr:uracil-DNA glycosylase [Opitutus terrae]ACB77138.1 phage SPO1 DNA polymerase-related protein [Opitutus terrae PB90-1]
MHHALTALTDELRRLKAAGVKTVVVSDDSVAALRRAVAKRGHGTPAKTVAERVEPSPGSPSIAEATEGRPTLATPEPDRGTVTPPVGDRAPAETEAPVARAATIPAPKPFTLPEGDKAARFAALREHVLADAVCCAHVRPGKKVVLGVGSLEAKIMFVGEAPGAEEEIQGEPFVGPAGQLLTKMIGAMGLRRDEVYIGNIMNWRPEMPVSASGVQYGNRPPNGEEMNYCLPYLRAQIEIVNPEVLVALGSTAAQGLLGIGSFKALGEVRGRWHTFADKPLMVTYHPSYILRNQSNRSKRMIWEDLLKVMERAGLPIAEKQRGYFLDK